MKRLVRTPGKEHFDQALAAKKPVILLVAHFVRSRWPVWCWRRTIS